VEVGEGLLGRVIDSDGVPLDGKGPIRAEGSVGMAGVSINPLAREPIIQPLDVGVRAINALLPIGRGQRVGLFAGSGVGKSTLLGMMTRYTAADVIVVGLIGERGREVRDFVETTLGEEGLRRAVVVAAPADRPPLARLHGAYRATAIAEWFRDQGLNVLLLMDSLTRFAQAQREIGLSVGEPPTTRGYPPSACSPSCRRWLNALATVPRAAARSPPSTPCSPKATTRRTPSPTPPAPSLTATSCSRAGSPTPACTRPSTWSPRSAAWSRTSPTTPGACASASSSGWWRRTTSNRDLIAIGAYQRGNDPATDEALERWPEIVEFLGQDVEPKAADLPHSRDCRHVCSRRLVEQEGERPMIQSQAPSTPAAPRAGPRRRRSPATWPSASNALDMHAIAPGRCCAVTPTNTLPADGQRPNGGTSPAHADANRRAFLDRLDSAVQQQRKPWTATARTVDAERARLLLASRDKQVLEQLAASYPRPGISVVTDRRDQREMDDLGARRVRASGARRRA
jgi:flagellum-specific ATP synthase